MIPSFYKGVSPTITLAGAKDVRFSDGTRRYGRNDVIVLEGINASNNLGIRPAHEDYQSGETVALLLVDMQVDFIHPDGALSVPGAMEDSDRLLRWAYRNVGKITHIMASIDTHLPHQIFHPAYWRENRNGRWEMPHPFTSVDKSNYMNPYVPMMTPGFDVDDTWNESYITALAQSNKKSLMLWPTHCLEGSVGRSLLPEVSDMLLYHSAARQTNPTFKSKGDEPATEQYSIFGAEIPVPSNPSTQIDATSLEMLASHSRIYVAGQAKSHCVLETLGTIIGWGKAHASHMLENIYVLMDATSSVQHPTIDFDGMVTPIYNQWAKDYGLNLVYTTEDIN